MKSTPFPGEASDILSDILEECICTMRLGEKCELKLQPQILKEVDIPGLPKDECSVTFSIHIASFVRGKELWELTDEEKLDLARRHKATGTEKFRRGDVKAAAMCYSKALKHLVSANDMSHKDITALRLVLLLNLAACQLKFQHNHHAAINCSKVLDLKPDNVKALYRRGQALTNMNDFDKAREDLLKARQLEPGNRAIDELIRVLELKRQNHKEKIRDALKTMFGGKP